MKELVLMIDYVERLTGVRRDPDNIPSIALLPARLFLGITFIYAGLNKLTDPQFFSPTAPGFIGRQMSGFVHNGSPLSPLLTHLAIPHAAQFGGLIAFCELWVGLSALFGLLTRVGALGGMAISLTLFLTATWKTSPYFLGADLPYALGWLTLALAGPGRYSLDDYFFGRALRERDSALERARAQAAHSGRKRPASIPAADVLAIEPVTRNAFMRGLSTAAAVVVGGGVAGGIARLLTPKKSFASAASQLAAAPPTAAPGGAAAKAPAGMTLLGNAKKLIPLNQAGQYTDPISGDPALLIHLPNNTFVAYDAVCTHAGCTVQYDPSQQQIVCPCHGAAYDPAHGAQVIAGPAPQPLTQLQVYIDPQGNAFARTSAGGSGPTATPQTNNG